MISKRKIITIDIILITLWTYILFSYITIYKTESWLLDINPYYKATLIVLYASALLYVQFYITPQKMLNLVITTFLFFVTWHFTSLIVDAYVGHLVKLDNQYTPLGWEFKYRFLDMFITNIAMLLLLEIFSRLLPEQWRRKFS